ncbi:TIGR04255 family protein [Pseudomonas sp. EpS/L25]|uniref:TIGR04255 family protein n=1 Tax=Pseudomonas sp. EpS/L25 TaxID=1749078 RepID=UPI001365DBCB|nr:TIGR04255 family protein [Pseudomonas sp. EpS/L25]
MNERFENSPLIEIIAELRWDLPGHTQSGLPMGMPVMPVMPPVIQQHELPFSTLTRKVAELGYGNSERLVPPGFPCLVHEPIIRYRFTDSSNAAKTATLYQVGPGIFTANALPPSYTSWVDFEPTVKLGIESLLASDLPFLSEQTSQVSVLLRYVDAFTDDYTDGRNLFEFARDVLGIKLTLPDAFSNVDGGLPTKLPTLHLVQSLPFGELQLKFAEGHVRGDKAIILEMTAEVEEKVEKDSASILQAFAAARNAIHSVFIDLTKPIHDRMKLVEERI